jgi:hypothetical protein
MNTHSQRLERWLGTDQVELLSQKMRGFYAPIALANIPGREPILAMPDGDFSGRIIGGQEACMRTKLEQIVAREAKIAKARRGARLGRATRQLGGFTSLGDLITEMSGGKKQTFNVAKAGVTGVANVANSLWDVGVAPASGTTAAGGTEVVPTNTTTGGLLQANATGGDTLHFVGATISGTVAANFLLMYDRFYSYGHNIATQSPTGLGAGGNAPTRYQDATSKSCFLTAFVNSAGALGGTPGTWNPSVVDQDGNTAANAGAQTLTAASIARRFPFAASVGNGWFFPLAAGDTGVRRLDAITQSVATGTGVLDVVLAKPIVWIPILLANVATMIDGINSSMNLERIVDNACLAFMEVNKGATTATSYSGQVVLCSG